MQVPQPQHGDIVRLDIRSASSSFNPLSNSRGTLPDDIAAALAAHAGDQSSPATLSELYDLLSRE